MTTFFGHPRGLATLFFTEMWERFGFYGVRAILIYFMTAKIANGGLGFPTAQAAIIYGLFLSSVYLLSLPGGWVADNILGQRKAVLYGGIIISVGYYLMALPGLFSFYSSLTLVVLGTGLLKPNVSTIVGGLYAENDPRRDAGFSIFYMGINTGALVAPLIIGTIGEKINYRYGLALSGFGMTLGIIQYLLGVKHLGNAGLPPAINPVARRRALIVGGSLAAIVVLIAFLASRGAISAEGISDGFGAFLTILTVLVFSALLLAPGWKPVERKRLVAIFVLFLASAMFWSAFEQAGSTLSLFAQRSTRLSLFGWGFPASWFQILNSVFLVLLAPVFAIVWVRLGKHEPSTTIKFTLGLVFVGLGFAVLIPVANGTAVSPLWLVLTYFLHSVGELCLSPVGLSAMTKLAPAKIAAMIMGVWFLSISVGEFIGGRVAALYEQFRLSTLFTIVALFCIACAAILVCFNRPMKKLSGGIN
jgi:POT family proton-dependent oligopeptide transporter